MATATILKANVRATDVVARFGGEEFILAFPNTDRDMAKFICERIVQAFMDTHHHVGGSEDLTITVSVGIATQCEQQKFESVDAIINAADKALYTAKLQGRNRSIPFDQLENLQVGQM